jgi:hypothetical protein
MGHQTIHGTPELSHGTPELSHGTPELSHGMDSRGHFSRGHCPGLGAFWIIPCQYSCRRLNSTICLELLPNKPSFRLCSAARRPVMIGAERYEDMAEGTEQVQRWEI